MALPAFSAFAVRSLVSSLTAELQFAQSVCLVGGDARPLGHLYVLSFAFCSSLRPRL